jgi:23S rRNA (uracil1939-C5)-methyltransferase
MNEKQKIAIQYLSYKGQGVGVLDNGERVYLPGTWPGDLCEIEAGRVVNILSSTVKKALVPCSHQGAEPGKCGGCPWMMIDYAAQLEQKQERVEFALKKQDIDIPSEKIRPIWASPQTIGYRNRAQFKTDGVKLGYVSQDSHELAPIKDCSILNTACRDLLKQLHLELPNEEWQPQGDKKWNAIDIDDAMDAREVTLNQRRPFRQGNADQNERMRSWLEQCLEPFDRQQEILELFCGAGNFTELMAKMGFKSVRAVEVSSHAIQQLEALRLEVVYPVVLDLYDKENWDLLASMAPKVKLLVLDPPRLGLKHARSLKKLTNLEHIFYISCDAISFAKDTKELLKQGWHLNEVQPLDLFPHTPHVELLAQFKR